MGKYKGKYLFIKTLTIIMTYRGWKISIFLERNSDFRAKQLHGFHFVDLLGFALLWDPSLKRERNSRKDYFEENERIYWKTSPRSSPHKPRKYEP
jgi:hypothetical protein